MRIRADGRTIELRIEFDEGPTAQAEGEIAAVIGDPLALPD